MPNSIPTKARSLQAQTTTQLTRCRWRKLTTSSQYFVRNAIAGPPSDEPTFQNATENGGDWACLPGRTNYFKKSSAGNVAGHRGAHLTKPNASVGWGHAQYHPSTDAS